MDPKQQASHAAASIEAWSASRILFEDEWLVVVDKPAGLPTQPTLDAARPSVVSVLKAFLTKRDGGDPYLGLHHRLDRDTSGVLLFTKDAKANAGVGAMFAEKTAQKTYQALALAGAGCADAWEVKNYLGIVGRVRKANKFGAVRSGGDPAQTMFRLVERFGSVAVIEASPRTGRTHQIRVHLSEDGHPILGDELYGGPLLVRLAAGASLRVSRVMLHASALQFRHPVTQTELTVRSPLPADFSGCVERLRKNNSSSR